MKSRTEREVPTARREWSQIRPDAVAVFLHPDRVRRAVIFQRPDGTFDFEEQQFLEKEDSWASLRKQTATVVDSLEGALSELKGRLQWVREL